MEHENNGAIPNLTGCGRTSSSSSSYRRRSSSLSRTVPFEIDDDIESENVSQAGDDGGRDFDGNRDSESGSIHFSLDNEFEKGVDKETGMVLPPLLEYVSLLVYLSAFGILGVLTRYLLQKLFGPTVAAVTSWFFLDGMVGCCFKPDLASVSDHLAIGLTTGYLGSLTTFSGWNQKMLDLIVDGHWVDAVVGFVTGLILAAYSIILGIATTKCFKSLLKRQNRSKTGTSSSWRGDSCKRHVVVMAALVLMLAMLWSVSGALLREEFSSGSNGAQLWLACLVAPPGVWIRWFLAQLNGRGLGRTRHLKWVPFGTLIANVSAACIMAALATFKKAVHTKTINTISTGIQFGFLGCLCTVSTFIAEYNVSRTWSFPINDCAALTNFSSIKC